MDDLFHLCMLLLAGSIIGNIRRQYVDTRTQTNLSKLNAKSLQNVDFVTEDFSQIVKRRKRSCKIFIEYVLSSPIHLHSKWIIYH